MKLDVATWDDWWDRMDKICREMRQNGPTLIALRDMDDGEARFGSSALNDGRHPLGDHADPTLSQVEARAAHQAWVADRQARGLPIVDRVDLWIESLFATVPKLYEQMMMCKKLNHLIERRADQRTEHACAEVKCAICESVVTGVGDDRLKLGHLCETDYKAWKRYAKAEIDAGRDASPVLFRQQRTAELDARKRAS